MTERPIIFSAPMVRAILEGRKTQTRRVLKPQPSKPWESASMDGTRFWTHDSLTGEVIEEWKLRYAIGDLLWVREACFAEELSRPRRSRPATAVERQRYGRTTMIESDEMDGADGVRYLADGAWVKIENTAEAGEKWSEMFYYRRDHNDGYDGSAGRLVSPIHMPRWASRITLRVTDVRVQRLQDISEEEAKAEGMFRIGTPPLGGWKSDASNRNTPIFGDAYRAFRHLWNNLHGLGSWDANPWVAAISFEPTIKDNKHD